MTAIIDSFTQRQIALIQNSKKAKRNFVSLLFVVTLILFRTFVGNMSGRPLTVFIYEEEARLISNWTLQYPNIETGGDLFGLWQNESEVVIQVVLGPGENCRRHPTSFFQDEQYLSDVGNFLTSEEGLCNIGGWHSHHTMNLPTPSAGDEATVWEHLPTSGRFLLLIASIENSRSGPKVGMTFWLFDSSFEKKKMLSMNCKIVEGKSPIRMNPAVNRKIRSGAERDRSGIKLNNQERPRNVKKRCEGGRSYYAERRDFVYNRRREGGKEQHKQIVIRAFRRSDGRDEIWIVSPVPRDPCQMGNRRRPISREEHAIRVCHETGYHGEVDYGCCVIL